MTRHTIAHLLPVFTSALLAACGGGGDDSAVAGPPFSEDPRVLAATETANKNAMCAESVLGPFYWEIGDGTGALASGSVGTPAVTSSQVMNIASASKWIYAAYVVQKVGVRTADIPFLNFTSGYSNFGLPFCGGTDTVGTCLEGHDTQDPATVGRYSYESGHMQHHAAFAMGLANKDNTALATEVLSQIGPSGFSYSQPLLAGGMAGSADDYSGFLRRILRSELAIAASLGSHKVCTNPVTCATAVNNPISDTESWNYSLGHWVEDDPAYGDRAFSSAGALGFYPWIDSTRSHYGMLARQSGLGESEAGYHSAQCGRLIRQAWRTGKAVTAPTPSPSP
jgi:hypothetical protein